MSDGLEAFNALNPDTLTIAPFEAIGKDWMLITAEAAGRINPMTASWGALGVLWHKCACTCYIRHSRYTLELMEQTDVFSLTFFPPERKEWLTHCGSHSGRDEDKPAKLGMTPLRTPHGVIWQECRLGIVCRRMYAQDMNPDRIPEEVKHDCYPHGDFHRMIIGEVLEVWKRA